MDDLKKQQEEALKAAGDYCTKLISAIENVAHELENNKLSEQRNT